MDQFKETSVQGEICAYYYCYRKILKRQHARPLLNTPYIYENCIRHAKCTPLYQ